MWLEETRETQKPIFLMGHTEVLHTHTKIESSYNGIIQMHTNWMICPDLV